MISAGIKRVENYIHAMSLQDPNNAQLYHFADALASPDPYFTQDYTARHRGKGTPIIIDNGSSYCRMGWAGDDDPAIVFRNAVARNRGKKGETDQVCIGNDIASVEAVRSSLRNQFDRSLVSNFTYQEQLLDYGFSHLGLHRQTAVRHPVVMTEPVCNPGYCRGQMSELLFEAYNVPCVAYGIDALFGAHHSSLKQLGRPLEDGVVVSCGHGTTHILPVVSGRLDAAHSQRINLGGVNVVAYLNRLLQLSHPPLLPHLTLTRAQEMVHSHCYLAIEYSTELQDWASGGRSDDIRVAQLPYSPSLATPLLVDAAGKETRDKQRRERAREQLLKINQRKREEKIAEYEMELEKLLSVQGEREQIDPEEYSLLLEETGFPSHEALVAATQALQTSLETEQQRLASLLQKLNSPDLGSEAVSEEWLQSLRERQKELMEQRRQRRQQRQELGKRRSAASQNRMRIISQLAEEGVGKKSKRNKEDTFGMNDDDWNVYRAINRDTGGSDSEREDIELADIKKVLDKHDPGYMKAQALPAHSSTAVSTVASLYQLPLGVERFRAPEILFQPTMVGVDQCGISDTIEYVLQSYSADIQQRLVENIYVTGGTSLIANFAERLTVDIRRMRPYTSIFSVLSASDKQLDGWRGASAWGREEGNRTWFVTRAEYQERGCEFLKEHPVSNPYITPLST